MSGSSITVFALFLLTFAAAVLFVTDEPAAVRRERSRQFHELTGGPAGYATPMNSRPASTRWITNE